jgi:basic membrane protein A
MKCSATAGLWRWFGTLLTALLALAAIGIPAAEFKVALVLDRGGKDDKSFNASAYEGAMRAKEQLKILLKYVEAPDDNAFEPLLRGLAQREFDLIIGIGFAQKEAVTRVAARFPKAHFAIVDAQVDAPNVRSLLFDEHEGAYLVGAIAALTSKTGKIGFVGGMDIPLIRRFALGYESGARKVNPDVQVLINYVGITSEAWNNPPKGKELAVSQYEQGADVIFGAAGASGLGVLDANQDWTKPGYVLTSMLKRVDEAVFATIKEATQGGFSAGAKRFGLANNGIGYSVDQYNATVLLEPVRRRAEEIKAEIISGKIAVPDYYKK